MNEQLSTSKSIETYSPRKEQKFEHFPGARYLGEKPRGKEGRGLGKFRPGEKWLIQAGAPSRDHKQTRRYAVKPPPPRPGLKGRIW
jgi:hypothetical protein